MKTLDLTDLSDGCTLDSFTIEDIHEFAMDVIRFHKTLRAELIQRLETGKPFKDAPTGINNPQAYEFLYKQFLSLVKVFEDDEMKFKLKKDKWEYIRKHELPWSERDIVNLDEVDDHIEYCRYNARLTRKRMEILEILRKEKCDE